MSLQFLKNSGLQIISCTEKTEQDIYTPNYNLPTAIIVGSEENGISQEFLKMSDFQAKKNTNFR